MTLVIDCKVRSENGSYRVILNYGTERENAKPIPLLSEQVSCLASYFEDGIPRHYNLSKYSPKYSSNKYRAHIISEMVAVGTCELQRLKTFLKNVAKDQENHYGSAICIEVRFDDEKDQPKRRARKKKKT